MNNRITFSVLLLVILQACGGASDPPVTSATLPSFVPSVVALPSIPAAEVLVTAFGAIPDDGIDDTAAIQRAINAVSVGGGTLVFPPGRYDVSIDPTLRRALTIQPRMRFLARPNAAAVLRLADNQVSYESIMAPISYPTRLDDVEFIGMTFDANGLANPIRNPKETNGDAPTQQANPTLRYFIRSFAGSRARIADCTFLNAESGNTVSFNGVTITDVTVERSRFLNVGGALIDHDHSSLYFYGKRFLLANNEFRSRNGAGTVGARTAFETHGDDIEVRDNLVDGFLQGVNVVGRVSDPSRQLLVGNRFINVAVGVNIWPVADGTNRAAFVDLAIRDNLIRIDADRWWRSPAMVVGRAAGIQFETGISRAGLDRIAIVGNQVNFDTFAGHSGEADKFSAGIAVSGVDGAMRVASLSILRNTVTNAIGPCVLSTAIVGPAGASQIADNSLTDCARSSHLVGAGDLLRAAIIIAGTTSKIMVNRNNIRASGVQPVMFTGILLASTCAEGCSASGNTITGINQPVLNKGTGWTTD
jgi:Pectate lyase superfamily protein